MFIRKSFFSGLQVDATRQPRLGPDVRLRSEPNGLVLQADGGKRLQSGRRRQPRLPLRSVSHRAHQADHRSLAHRAGPFSRRSRSPADGGFESPDFQSLLALVTLF